MKTKKATLATFELRGGMGMRKVPNGPLHLRISAHVKTSEGVVPYIMTADTKVEAGPVTARAIERFCRQLEAHLKNTLPTADGQELRAQWQEKHDE